VGQIANSFLATFNEYNLERANAELQDTIALCELNNNEKAQLFAKIRKELGKKHISLDCIDSH